MTAGERPALKFSLYGLAGAFGDFGTIIAFVSSMTVAFLVGIAAAYVIHKLGLPKIPGPGQ